MTLQHIAAVCAAVLGVSGVGLGAFGAHALKDVLVGNKLQIWQTASHYHLMHAVALTAVTALIAALGPQAKGAVAWSSVVGFVAGTALFSGSLYALALGAPRWVGPLTPLGGLLLIVAWGMVAAVGWMGAQGQG